MKRFMLVAVVATVAASGCVNTSQFLRSKSDSTNSFSQARNRSSGIQTVGYNAPIRQDQNVQPTGGLFYGLTGKHLDGCCGDCCECGCGYPDACCDCSCGCPDMCCESSCGCADVCCDSCCDCGCGCGFGGGFFRNLFSGGLLGKLRCRRCCGCNDCCNGGCMDGCGCRLGSRLAGCIASGGCCPHSGGYPEAYNFNPGPQGGQTAYPYYTTRGPRDFLMCNPQPLGPY